LDLSQFLQLNFYQPDLQRFPCLRLAYEALRAGQSAPVILNAVNEVAVDAFLNSALGFMQIDTVISQVLAKMPLSSVANLEAIFAIDEEARSLARSSISQLRH